MDNGGSMLGRSVRLVQGAARLATDGRLVVLLVLLAAAAATAVLLPRTEPMGNQGTFWSESFVCAIMDAAGYGFVRPLSPGDAGLDAFLSYRTDRLDPAEIHPTFLTGQPWEFEKAHRYLFLAVALTWKLFGISWSSLKFLAGLMFCLSVPLAYGVFRLGMNRGLSFAAAVLFMLTPVTLQWLPYLRDFSKLPFFLATLLLAGRLFRTGTTTRSLWSAALLLGAVQGVGIGFRPDVISYVPLAVLALMFCPLDGAAGIRGIPRRTVALGAFLAAFLAAGAPIHQATREDGSSTFHYVNMGLATECADVAGVGRSSYEFMPWNYDNIVVASAQSFVWRNFDYHRPTGWMTPQAEWAKRAYFLHIAKNFPADLLTRAYAAAVASLRVAGNRLDRMIPGTGALRPVYAHVGDYGPWYVAAALLLIAAVNLRTGLALLLLAGYVCCTMSLQFQDRHVFHLVLFPLWCAGFLFQSVLQGHLLRRFWEVMPSAVPRMALLVALTAALTVLPLAGARAWQRRTTDNLVRAHASASLEPVRVRTRSWEDQTLFCPQNLFTLRAAGNAVCDPDPTEYFVLKLASRPGPRDIFVRFQSEDPFNDFSQPIRVAPSGADENGTVAYFFPAYQKCSSPGTYLYLEGFALDRGQEKDFRGLYRVTDLTPFPMLLWLTLPEDQRHFRAFQTLPAFWPPSVRGVSVRRPLPSRPGRDQLFQGVDMMLAGDVEGALDTFRTVVQAAPDEPMPRYKLALAQAANGDLEGATASFKAAMSRGAPDLPLLYMHLDEVLSSLSRARRVAEWEGVLKANEDIIFAHQYLKWALLDAGRPEEAAAVSQRASERWPGFEESHGARPYSSRAAWEILQITALELLLRVL